MMWTIALLIPLLSLWARGVDAEEEKWRWGDGDGSAAAREDRELAGTRTANDYLSNRRPSSRYEIFENNEGGNFHNPGRPHDFRPPGDYQDRPDFGGGGFRPGRPGGLYGNGYGNGGYGGGQGVLTGPVPSWQREPPLKDFDRCKCTEKFNCNSPGISYGHCDVGKKYCCYNTHGVQGSPLPSRPHHSIHNGILSGPGGPVDYYPGSGSPHGPGLYPGGGVGRPPFRPSGDGLLDPRPPHGPGVLVGPGGPTGVVGRPPGYGSGGGGVLVGPGGPTGIAGRPPGHGIGQGVLLGPTGIGGRPPGHGIGQGVLVGPGGPTGIGGRPPGHGIGQGVLVGPGGPTGVVGRPPGGYGNGGSFGIGGAGLLVGPGGPHDRPYGSGFGGYRPTGFGIGRSAKNPEQAEKIQKE